MRFWWKKLLKRAGINPSLVEVANIREQCSWVHLSEKEEATKKAKEILEMAIAKAELLEAIDDIVVPITRRVLIIGGGVAGIQAALDLADDYEVILVEKSPTIGGKMALIDKTFPTMDCSICILGPKMADVGNHENVNLISCAEVTAISGYVGNFEVTIKKYPRYVDENLCTACGDCVSICPENVVDEYSGNLGWRKAIYIPYPQAVPASYIIDEKNCLGLTPLTCGKCVPECEKEAIVASIEKALSPEFRKFVKNVSNPYAKKDTASKIKEILKCCDFKDLTKKKFFDLKFDVS